MPIVVLVVLFVKVDLVEIVLRAKDLTEAADVLGVISVVGVVVVEDCFG